MSARAIPELIKLSQAPGMFTKVTIAALCCAMLCCAVLVCDVLLWRGLCESGPFRADHAWSKPLHIHQGDDYAMPCGALLH